MKASFRVLCCIFLLAVFGPKLASGLPLHLDSSSWRTSRDLKPPQQAQQDVKTVAVGEVLELFPDNSSVTDKIIGILWKHWDNKLADWYKKLGPLIDYYGIHKDPRVKLYIETGMLVIRNVTEEDRGPYTVQINGRPSKTYEVEVTRGDAAQNKTQIMQTGHAAMGVTLPTILGSVFGSVCVLVVVVVLKFYDRIKKFFSSRCCSEPGVTFEEIKLQLDTNGNDASKGITSDSISTPGQEVGVQQSLLGLPNKDGE